MHSTAGFTPARRPLIIALVVLALAAGAGCASRTDSHVPAVVRHITAARDAIVADLAKRQPGAPPDARFITVWDFDGTIIKGDCTEGLAGPGGYRGLAQEAVTAGFSTAYDPTAYPRFLANYERMKERDYQAACLMIPAAFAGARYDDLLGLSRRHFTQVLRHHYFASSRAILDALADKGIETVIISASPDFFVKGAAETLPLPAERIHGITMAVEGGRVTAKPRGVVTYAGGKTMKIHEIVAALVRTTPHVYVLAGFGNSYHTDGPFLAWIAGQRLPAGTPLAVMINGGDEPQEYRGRFMRVNQETVAKP